MIRKCLAGLFALLALVSCSSAGPAGFKGTYSFKTGGYITIVDGSQTLVRHLVPESGQMHVLPDGGDKMVVTMNITAGDPVIFNATVKDGNLVLDPVRRTVNVTLDLEDITTVSYTLNVSGIGRKMENLILFDMEYKGEPVQGSDVCCIATSNE